MLILLLYAGLLQGELCAGKPLHSILAGTLLIACLLGLIYYTKTATSALWRHSQTSAHLIAIFHICSFQFRTSQPAWLCRCYVQGELCARKPLHVILAGTLLISCCLLGLIIIILLTRNQACTRAWF
jgi:hypothetical protein